MSSRPPARVRVRVPATSANLGPGFDAFGIALTLYDEIVVELPGDEAPPAAESPVTGRRVHVQVSGEGADVVARDESHLIVRSIDATFERLGFPCPDRLWLRCHNGIPHARGLGSSAAAVVAGVLAARALVPDGERRLPEGEALRLAAQLEGHPDNVAACLLGGLTIAWDSGQAAAVRLEPVELDLVAYVPERSVSTKAARDLLPDQVPHADAAANAGRAGLLMGALTRAFGEQVDRKAWLVATDDLLHQPYRTSAMPESFRLLARLRDSGVPAVISGAGPAVLAFVELGELADDLRSVQGFRPFPLRIDRAGTTIRADLDLDTR